MEYDDLEILELDGSSLTIPKLKSILSARGKTLPVTKEKKDAYVKLFEELQNEEREKQKAKRKRTDSKDDGKGKEDDGSGKLMVHFACVVTCVVQQRKQKTRRALLALQLRLNASPKALKLKTIQVTPFYKRLVCRNLLTPLRRRRWQI